MISIIVPAYKSEKTIGRCLESLISQTYSDIEIIVVIDGPIDNTYDIAAGYAKKDNRIKVILKENQGVSMARNTGIQEAGGKYIQFVDSDDYVDKHLCETMLENVEKDDSDMVICGFNHIFLGKQYVKVPHKGVYCIENFIGAYKELYKCGFLNMPWNKLYKRDLIKENFPTDISLGEDLEFNLKYMKNIKKVSVVDVALINYIQDNGVDNLSAKKRNDKYDIAVRVCENAKDYYFWLKHKEEKTDESTEVTDLSVFNTRLITEFLDEIEGLPYDNTMPKQEKLNLIKKYSEDDYIVKAQESASIEQIDYKVINVFLKKKMIKSVYVLSVIRKMLVDFKRSV